MCRANSVKKAIKQIMDHTEAGKLYKSPSVSHCHTISVTLLHHHYHTVTPSLSHYHCHTVTPSLSHRHTFTLSHCHTATSSQCQCHAVTLSHCHAVIPLPWLVVSIERNYVIISHQTILYGISSHWMAMIAAITLLFIRIFIVTLLLSWHCYYRDIAIIVTWFICCLISVNFLTAVNLTIGEESENCLSEPSSVPLSAHSSVPPSAHSTISRPESLDDAPCSSDSKPGRSLQTDQLKLNLGLINESSAEKAAASGKKCFLSIVWDMLYHRKF